MRVMPRRYAAKIVCYAGMLTLCGSLTACVESVPPDVVQAIESVDNDLAQLRAAELAPSAYNAFAHQWVTLRSRVEAEEDTVRWPWESNDLEQALRGLQAEGARTVAVLMEQQETLRRSAARQLAEAEEQVHLLATQVGAIDSRLILGEKPVETDLLLKQARTFYEQRRYQQSLHASDRASHHLAAQSALLQRELGRYASPDRDSPLAAHGQRDH